MIILAKFCSNCGSELKQGGVFCSECGTKAEQSQIDNKESNVIWKKVTSQSDANKYKAFVIIIGMCVGLFVGGIIGYAIAPASKGDSQYKPTLMELLKDEWYNVGGTVKVTSKTSRNYMATALEEGRARLFLMSFAGVAIGGIVGAVIAKNSNKRLGI